VIWGPVPTRAMPVDVSANPLATTHAYCNCNRSFASDHPATTAEGPVSCITAGHGPNNMAEDGGFEPPRACTQHAFQLRSPLSEGVG